MLLNAVHYESPVAAAPLVIAHGLLGSARNWQALAKRLAAARPVLAVDMRNHGDSGWEADAGYEAQAADLAETIAAEADGAADVLGHSMGGKAAMMLALTQPGRVRRLIVADIAPVAYGHSHADTVRAMRALDMAAVARRADADAALREGIPDRAMRAFVLANLVLSPEGARWKPNLAALEADMPRIVGWPGPAGRFDGATLFLSGGASDYVTEAMRPAIRAQFPAARFEALEGAGHWLHAEQPERFLAAVEGFLKPG